MVMLYQQIHRPVSRDLIVDTHTVKLFILKRPVHQNDGNFILFGRL